MRPSRRTVAVVTSIFFRASREASAFDSWTKPIVALSSTTRAMTTGVSHSRVTTKLITAAISRMMISRSWNCRRNALQRGSFVASASWFGPSRSSRRVASAADSPSRTSTSSRSAVSSAEVTCQVCASAAAVAMAPSSATRTAGDTGSRGGYRSDPPAGDVLDGVTGLVDSVDPVTVVVGVGMPAEPATSVTAC